MYSMYRVLRTPSFNGQGTKSIIQHGNLRSSSHVKNFNSKIDTAQDGVHVLRTEYDKYLPYGVLRTPYSTVIRMHEQNATGNMLFSDVRHCITEVNHDRGEHSDPLQNLFNHMVK
jgi:hypothetical protein